MRVADFGAKRVAVWGLGSEGLAVVRAIRTRQPDREFTVLEEAANPAWPDWLQADEKIRNQSGRVTEATLREFDVVIRSPGISIYRPEIVAAKQAGVTFTSGTNLWFAENPGCKTVCVTGSKGKSTTTHLIRHLLERFGTRAVEAGNIGVPLLDLTNLRGETVCVVELSSYQLSDFEGTPTVAVLLNLYPEHLDWHHGEAAYFQDKAKLLKRVTRARIINWQDTRARSFGEPLGNIVYFNSDDGFHHDAAAVYRRRKPWIELSDIQLLGEHNLSNLCAALTAVEQCGVRLEKENVREALRDFRGLDHRLTKLGERDGVLYVNDSIATIPQATVAALRAFLGRPTTVLIGGYDRGLDPQEFAAMVLRESPFAVVTLPGTGAVLAQRLRGLTAGAAEGKTPTIHEAASLEEAAMVARELTPVGGVALLSPGAPSFNSHRNFVERGKAFAKAVGLPLQAET